MNERDTALPRHGQQPINGLPGPSGYREVMPMECLDPGFGRGKWAWQDLLDPDIDFGRCGWDPVIL